MALSERYYIELISGRKRGAWAGLARGLLGFLTIPYATVVAIRNAWYGWIPGATKKIGCPVISIGNVTVGGTGKTPFTAKVAGMLVGRGMRPAIILRGYRPGSGEFDAQRTESDEAMLLQRRSPGVTVIVDPDRVAGAREALRQQCNCIVLDDGFQHRRLARDLDIVLVDATRPFGHDHLLPRGLLREPSGGLRRAGLIVLSRSDQVDENEKASILSRVQRLSGGDVPTVLAQHTIGGFSDLRGGAVEVEDPRAMQAIIFAGIANFDGFRRSVEDIGVRVLAAYEYPDHHPYSGDEIAGLAETAVNLEANVVLTTEKDAVKLEGRWPERICRVLALRLEIELSAEGEKVLADSLDKAIGTAAPARAM